MATIRRFEDLECWQLARSLNKKIYLLASNDPISREYELKSQLKKAVLSISNNIAEGFGRFSDNDFVRFLDYSSGSCSETKNMLYLILDLGHLNSETVESLMTEVETIQIKILALIKYITNNPKK